MFGLLARKRKATQMNRTKHYPVPPYRVQKLLGRVKAGQVWGTVKKARPAVAERIAILRRTDGEIIRLVR